LIANVDEVINFQGLEVKVPIFHWGFLGIFLMAHGKWKYSERIFLPAIVVPCAYPIITCHKASIIKRRLSAIHCDNQSSYHFFEYAGKSADGAFSKE